MGEQPPNRAHDEAETTSPTGVRLIDVRDPLPDDLRDPSFPAAVRGYERHAVDAYVQRINRVIAELQVSGSPAAAVRHALDRVGEQTSGILHRARETAEEITKTGREEAEETTARAKAEAQDITTAAERRADEIVAGARTRADEILAGASRDAEGRAKQVEEEIASLRAEADAHLRTLQADITAVSEARRTAVDDVRRLSARLEAAAAEAADAEPATEQEPDEAAEA